jgi:hypothetical protein
MRVQHVRETEFGVPALSLRFFSPASQATSPTVHVRLTQPDDDKSPASVRCARGDLVECNCACK